MTSRLGRVAVVFGALAFVLVAVGTGAYSSTTADRGVSIDVVDDAEAFFGLEREVVVDTENSTNVSLTVTNRLSTAVDVEIVHRSTENGPPADIDPAEFELEPGETRAVRVAIDCRSTASTDDVELNIYGVGNTAEIELERAIDARCD
ncbi:hypothetical protein [Natronomonas sp.]|uniref:hypothetical protein n=1 Tax=Natronomonas sp. TaxID=2184060 RepID=UPI003976095C